MGNLIRAAVGISPNLDFSLQRQAAPNALQAPSPEIQQFFSQLRPEDNATLEQVLRFTAARGSGGTLLADPAQRMSISAAPELPPGQRSQILAALAQTIRQIRPERLKEDALGEQELGRAQKVFQTLMDGARATAPEPPAPQPRSTASRAHVLRLSSSGMMVEAYEEERPRRRVTIAGKSYEFTANSSRSWFYPLKDGPSQEPGPVKIHVVTDSPEDLDRLQAVLIPALLEDPSLSPLIDDFKTIDPLFAVGKNKQATGVRPNGKHQGAKAFTLYTKDALTAAKIRDRLTEIISRNNLAHAVPVPTENVDTMDPTHRVGTVRDRFFPAISRENQRGLLIDPLLARRIRQEFRAAFGMNNGETFSEDQLREIERRTGLRPGILAYGRLGSKKDPKPSGRRLMMITSKSEEGDDFAELEHPDYAAEAGAGKSIGDLSDRPALYALARRYGIDLIELGSSDILIEDCLKPGESILVGRNSVGVQAASLARRHARVGRLSTGEWYLQQGDEPKAYTAIRLPGGQWRDLARGERVILGPQSQALSTDVSLGGVWRLRLVKVTNPDGRGGY